MGDRIKFDLLADLEYTVIMPSDNLSRARVTGGTMRAKRERTPSARYRADLVSAGEAHPSYLTEDQAQTLHSLLGECLSPVLVIRESGDDAPIHMQRVTEGSAHWIKRMLGSAYQSGMYDAAMVHFAETAKAKLEPVELQALKEGY